MSKYLFDFALEDHNPADEIIAVDLDGTLAFYDHWRGVNHIGAPIMPMVNKIKHWLAEGKKVKIFTARVHNPEALPIIKLWLDKIDLGNLTVTNIKEPMMIMIYDDRARQVEMNTGRILNDN